MTYSTNVAYVTSWGTYFVSPDGIGRYFYDTMAEVLEEHGPLTAKAATPEEESE